MYYYCIVNPNSGNGRGLKIWNQAKALLNKLHEEYDVYMTVAVGDAANKAREVSKNQPREEMRLLVFGGDGTFNEVLNGLDVNSSLVVGYVPSGSGNDLARGLGFSRNIRRHINKIIADPYIEQFDYGVISCGENGPVRRFAVSCGAGYDAAVCHELMESAAKDFLNRFGLGKLAYTLVGIRVFIMCHKVKGYLVLDESERVEFNNILFTSMHIHPFEGGGYHFGENADPTDGMLEICVMSTANKLKMVPILLNGKKKTIIGKPGVRKFRCKEVQIHFEKPMAIHTDGESLMHQKDMVVRCVQRKLKMLI